MDIIAHIQQQYGVFPEYLWEKYPQFCIFRRFDNQKWFAALMKNMNAQKLGLATPETVDILNLKCDPEFAKMILIDHKSIFPAYHMNKKHWISVVLNRIADDELKNLIAHSYQQTQSKKKSFRQPEKK